MHIKTITVGPIETNCYVVADEAAKECAVIDPGDEPSLILDYLEDAGLTCRCILLTHAHFDHVGAVAALREETGAALYMNAKDNGVPIGFEHEAAFTAPPDTIFYKDGDIVELGAVTFQVMETPGHTPGSVCLLCGDAIFSGDTLFRDSCGRTDFLASSAQDMFVSLKRLGQLPGNYDVFPGHMFSTTLDRERRFNCFLRMAMES